MSEKALERIAENKRTRDTYLDLSKCDLKLIPEEVGELVWLEILGLSYNRELDDLTPLSSLTGLHRFLLNDTQVSDLTPLSNLTMLLRLD